MKVNLSIQDDAELRAYIKDMIKGQITSIAREEIINVINEVSKAKIPSNQSELESIIRYEAERLIKEELFDHYGLIGNTKISDMAKEILKEMVVDNFPKIIKDMWYGKTSS